MKKQELRQLIREEINNNQISSPPSITHPKRKIILWHGDIKIILNMEDQSVSLYIKNIHVDTWDSLESMLGLN